MNTTFSSQLIGFLLSNGTFVNGMIPRVEIKDADYLMMLRFPRNGQFELTVTAKNNTYSGDDMMFSYTVFLGNGDAVCRYDVAQSVNNVIDCEWGLTSLMPVCEESSLGMYSSNTP